MLLFNLLIYRYLNIGDFGFVLLCGQNGTNFFVFKLLIYSLLCFCFRAAVPVFALFVPLPIFLINIIQQFCRCWAILLLIDGS